MKISSTATVLGGIADISTAKTILDIGTGTGLLALMAAQRNLSAQITAIEMEDAAAAQSAENFRNSPWKERLTLVHTNVLDLPTDFGTFDIILCNPPFFHAHLPSQDEKRKLARHSSELNPISLANVCHNFLSEKGQVWLLIAETTFTEYSHAFSAAGFHLPTQYLIFDKPTSSPVTKNICRVLCFQKEETFVKSEMPFYLRSENDPYSPEIRQLLKDFLIVL